MTLVRLAHERAVVLGVDFSTRACAAVAVPTDWGGDWSRVEAFEFGLELPDGSTDDERAAWTEEIARRVVEFAARVGAKVAWFESYAFDQNVKNSRFSTEAQGVVRLELKRAGVGLRTGNMGTARKLLLGKVPVGERLPSGKRQKGVAKKAVVSTLEAAGARFATVDQFEAFVIANLGLSLEHEGAYFLAQVAPALPLPLIPTARRRRGGMIEAR